MFLVALMLLFLLPGRALAQGTQISAKASPDRYYEPFDSMATVKVSNTGDTAITFSRLLIGDTAVEDPGVTLAPGESREFTVQTRIDEKKLSDGFFFVTLYYKYIDEYGNSIPARNQILTSVHRLEDKIEARMYFALPDRSVEGEDSVLVSYILENCGETGMANAVMICYPDEYIHSPVSIAAGDYICVKRNVPADALDELSALVSCQSAYSGKEFSFEFAYDGNLLDEAEDYGEDIAETVPTPSLTPDDEKVILTGPTIRAEAVQGGILVNVYAGNETLTDVTVSAGDQVIKALKILGKGLGVSVLYEPDATGENDYVFILRAALSNGEALRIDSESVRFTSIGQVPSIEKDDLLMKIVEAGNIRAFVLSVCAAMLTVLLVTALIRKKRRKAAPKAKAKDEN